MNRDVTQWSRTYLQCQRSKVHRHTSTLPASFLPPDARFAHVHIDIVGPLPSSAGSRYLLTMIDRFTRWPDAVPIPAIDAHTVAHTVVAQWVSRFGAPTTLTTDRGAQFESSLLSALLKLLGTVRTRTTAYHPRANGMIERFHRHLKGSLKATEQTCHWSEAVPLILLSI